MKKIVEEIKIWQADNGWWAHIKARGRKDEWVVGVTFYDLYRALARAVSGEEDD